MSRRWLAVLLVALFSTGSVAAGCGGDDDDAGGGSGSGGGGGEAAALDGHRQKLEQIAVSFDSRDRTRSTAQIQEGIEHEAKARGIETTFAYANNDAKQQVDQMENAITRSARRHHPRADRPGRARAPRSSAPRPLTIPVVTTGNNLSEDGQSIQIGQRPQRVQGDRHPQGRVHRRAARRRGQGRRHPPDPRPRVHGAAVGGREGGLRRESRHRDRRRDLRGRRCPAASGSRRPRTS